MSSNGGFGREYARFHSKLEEKLAKKRQQPCSAICSWIKRKTKNEISWPFLRGLRSMSNHVSIENDPTVSEGLSEIIWSYKEKHKWYRKMK